MPTRGELIARECPNLARSAKFFRQEQWDATFELGLEALLAALAPPRRRRA